MSKNTLTDENIINNIKNMDHDVRLPEGLDSIDKIMENKSRREREARNRASLIAASLFVAIFLGTSPVLSKTFEKIFGQMSVDEGVISAQDNNKISKIDKVVQDNGIKVTLKGAISDGVRTVLSIRFYSKSVKLSSINLNRVTLIDSEGKKYQMNQYGRGMDERGEDYFDTSIEFSGSPSKKTSFKLNIGKINNVEGNWNFEFDLTPIPIEEFKTNATYNDGKILMSITSVKMSATYTMLEANMKGIDLNCHAVLSNSKGLKVEEDSAGGGSGRFEIYFPPLAETDEFNLTIVKSITDNTPILSVKIPLKK